MDQSNLLLQKHWKNMESVKINHDLIACFRRFYIQFMSNLSPIFCRELRLLIGKMELSIVCELNLIVIVRNIFIRSIAKEYVDVNVVHYILICHHCNDSVCNLRKNRWSNWRISSFEIGMFIIILSRLLFGFEYW